MEYDYERDFANQVTITSYRCVLPSGVSEPLASTLLAMQNDSFMNLLHDIQRKRLEEVAKVEVLPLFKHQRRAGKHPPGSAHSIEASLRRWVFEGVDSRPYTKVNAFSECHEIA